MKTVAKFGQCFAVLSIAGLLTLGACVGVELRPPAPEVVARDAGDVVNDREIVVLVPSERAATQLLSAAGIRGYVLLRRHRLNALDMTQMVLQIPQGTSGGEAIAELEAIQPGSTAGVNHAYRLQAAPSGGRVYAFDLMQWSPAACKAAVPIGMIDGAVDPSVAALSSAYVMSQDFTSGTEPDLRHGTAVAEVLAGQGRLTDVKLYSAVVVDASDAPAGVDVIVRALDWLSAAGVRLVNVSLAGPYNKILDRGLQAATRRGMIMVAAVGNSGAGSPPRYPAAFSDTLGITAVDARLHRYTNAPTGSHIDFAAPGVDIYVEIDGAGRYLSGTSMSAPFVTALIASDPAVASKHSIDAIRASLGATALDLGEDGRDAVFGYGLPLAAETCHVK